MNTRVRSTVPFLVNESGVIVGYVDKNNIERNMAGVPLAPEAASGGGIGLLAQSGAPVSVTGTTTETVQASIPIPAGVVGPNGVLRITPLWSAPVNADSNTYRCRVAGTVLFATTLANDGSFSPIITARNTGSALVALGGTSLGVGGSGSVPTSLAVDMTAPQSLTITAQLASAADTVTLLGYTVEVLNP